MSECQNAEPIFEYKKYIGVSSKSHMFSMHVFHTRITIVGIAQFKYTNHVRMFPCKEQNI